jgi:hypothetical protein
VHVDASPLPQRMPLRGGAHVVVPVRRIDRSTMRALAYARSISPFMSVFITGGAAVERRLRELGVAESADVQRCDTPGDEVAGLSAFLDRIASRDPGRQIAVVLSEVVPRRAWLYPLHDQTALRLKLRLFARPNTAVIDVPFHV